MATTADIRNGLVIMHKNKRMKVVDFQHVKPGKGGAFVRTKLKDINSGKIIDETFNSGHRIELVRIDVKQMQYLYFDNNSYVFMDNETFDQINLFPESINNSKYYLKPGLNVEILFDSSEVIELRLPSHVILEVVDTEPGFKGNTATGATKPATCETGYTLSVPLFVEIGQKLKIDTRTGNYVERSKS